jgi:archaellum biogenesis ATPase FlaH
VDLYKLQGRTPPGVKSPKPDTTLPAKIYSKEEIRDFLKSLGTIEKIHEYRNWKGEMSFWVARVIAVDGKTFRPFKPQTGGYVFGLPPAPRVLYNLPEILKAETVVIVEGEKCADILTEYGIAATTSCGGAKGPRHSDWGPVADKYCIIWPDADSEGLKYGQDVQAIILEINPQAKVSVIEPSSLALADKEDCVDFIEHLKSLGKTKGEIQAELFRVMQLAKTVRPSAPVAQFFNKVASGELVSISLPFNKLTEIGRPLLPAGICLLCGTPGSGKSFFVLQSMLFWLVQGVKFTCYFLEETLEHHLQRAITLLEDKPDILDMGWLKANAEEAGEYYDKHADTLDQLTRCIRTMPVRQETYSGLITWAESQIKLGKKLLIVDPITATQQSDKPWLADDRFINDVRKLVIDVNATALITIHPKKGMTAPCLDDISGGAAWQRFATSVLWVEYLKEPRDEHIQTPCGTADISINRIIHIAKGRNAPGVGCKIGFTFGGRSLLFAEQGIIRREHTSKGQGNG